MKKTSLFIAVMLSAVSVTGVKAQTSPTPQPIDSLPPAWTPSPLFNQTLPVDDGWWKLFDDPTLTALINNGEKHNYNLAAAIKRIEIAKNSLNQIKSGYYPTLTAAANWNWARESSRTGHQYAEQANVSYLGLGASMQWEIDVFGRISAQTKSAKAAVNLSKADYDATMVAVAAKIAKAYIQLRMYQAELEVVNQNIKSQQHILDIAQIRMETGLSSGLDVAQAKQVLLGTKAMLSNVNSGIATCINTLATLTGRFPGDLQKSLSAPAPLPSVAKVAPVGVPADILRRRPDIIEAEMQLAQYAANIGIAKKDFLPTLSLTAEISTQSHEIGKMFSSNSYTWSVAPQLEWTIFDGFSRNYKTAEAKLQFEAALDNYNMTILNAYQEVENAMISYSYAISDIDNYKLVLAQDQKTLDLSFDLYKQGLSDFSNVASAQISLLQTRNKMISSQADALTALITMYQALGGGWQSSQVAGNQ